MSSARIGTPSLPRTWRRLVAAAPVICGAVSAYSLPAQELRARPLQVTAPVGRTLPFAAGERLVYDAHAGPGLNGRAEMWITGPEEVRGTPTLVLNFSFDTRVGPLRVSDRTTSWLDPLRMASLRFTKQERRLLARRAEDVRMHPDTRQWVDAEGGTGESPSDAPLDELSFIYLVRSMSFAGDSVVVLNRHFDARRNPTTLRALGRSVVTTPAGTFTTREVEMRVHDSRTYEGEGVIRFSLSDDECRRPVRIQSSVPGAGTVVMTLASAFPAIEACAPRIAAPAP